MKKQNLPKWMRKTIGSLLIIFLGLLIINQLHGMKSPAQIMRISAEGKVSAVPDVAQVLIGVSTQGLTPAEVKNSNNQKINQVIAFIKQQGIDAKDIQTTGFYASPRYDYSNGQNNIVGYQANQTINVKVTDVDKSQALLEKILDGVVSQGANEIQGVNFSFSDPDKLKQEARKIAIKKAQEKAKELTDEAGLNLGRVINVSDNGNEITNPASYAAVSFARANKSVAPNIEPGSQEIIETITLTFEVN